MLRRPGLGPWYSLDSDDVTQEVLGRMLRRPGPGPWYSLDSDDVTQEVRGPEANAQKAWAWSMVLT